MQPQQPIYVVSQPQTSAVIKHFSSATSRMYGIIQIMAGALCVISNITGMALGSNMSYVGYGIWGGAFFIVTGSIGLGAAAKRTKCLIVAYMVLSIIAVSVFVIPIIVCSAIGLQQDYYFHCSWDYDYRYPIIVDRGRLQAKQAMHGLLITLAVIQGLIGIFSSAQGCSTICCRCCRRSNGQQQEHSQRGQINAGFQSLPIGQPGQIMMSVPQSSYQPGTQFVLLPQTMIGSTVSGLPQVTVAGVSQQGVIQPTGSTTRQVMPQAAGGATGFTPQQPNDPNKQGTVMLSQAGSLPPAYEPTQTV